VTPAGVVTTLSQGFSPADWEGIAIDGAGNIFGSGGSSQWVSLSPITWGASVNELTVSGTVKNVATNWETSTTNSAVGWGGLAVDGSENLYLADIANNRIVKFSASGVMSVFAGSGAPGSNDGVGTAAEFNNPTDLAIDSTGNIFVIDSANSSVRKITADGTVSTFAKVQGLGQPIAVDPSGNVYVVAFPRSAILRIDQKGNATSFPYSGITDFITALVADSGGNLYAGTRGIGAQILKFSF
jgi:hypothetical protein